jgi:hypothetical protein
MEWYEVRKLVGGRCVSWIERHCNWAGDVTACSARARQLLGNRTVIDRRPYGMNSTVAIEYIRRRLV